MPRARLADAGEFTQRAFLNDKLDLAEGEAVAELMLGAALGQIALNYDKGYFVDENADLTNLSYVDRKALRDSAIVKLQSAATIAAANTFDLPDAWHGAGGNYDNNYIVKLANTLAAMTLAYWPRTDAENASVDWAQVATFAAAGITEDFVFVGDGCASICPEMQSWTNDIFGIRVHTRLPNLLFPCPPLGLYLFQPERRSRGFRLGARGIRERWLEYDAQHPCD